jgi:hypothetical protein
MASVIEVGSQKVLELTGIQIGPPNLMVRTPQYSRTSTEQTETSAKTMIACSHRQ